MNFLVLGRGKTGSLVAEYARERHHHVRVLGAKQNQNSEGLNAETLRGVDTVIDFTCPTAVRASIDACLREKKNLVVGTTGWQQHLGEVRARVEEVGSGFLYGANFSIGMNLFFEAVQIAAEAAGHGYSGQIFERHHEQKKDAPSGTALVLQKIVKEKTGAELEITSFREGDVVGLHELIFNSPNDRIYLCHDAKSRRGYAEGAVLGAEWLSGKSGFYQFKDIWREL
jgi:4-hydroxy-tetrahydrodipicolinate reductase